MAEASSRLGIARTCSWTWRTCSWTWGCVHSGIHVSFCVRSILYLFFTTNSGQGQGASASRVEEVSTSSHQRWVLFGSIMGPMGPSKIALVVPTLCHPDGPSKGAMTWFNDGTPRIAEPPKGITPAVAGNRWQLVKMTRSPSGTYVSFLRDLSRPRVGFGGRPMGFRGQMTPYVYEILMNLT